MLPILLFLIFIFTIYYTVHPFFSEKVVYPEQSKNPNDIANKRRLVNIFKQIRETEFEHDMGIIADEDFERTRSELKLEASNLLENNDPISKSNTCFKCDNSIKEDDKFCSDCGLNLTEKMCSNCNIPINENDKFCSQCGTNV